MTLLSIVLWGGLILIVGLVVVLAVFLIRKKKK